MSYILDALRKSEQQRQRGAAPTLSLEAPAAAAPKPRAYLAYGLLAVVLLGAGIAIGWLRPWQAVPAAPAVRVVAAPASAVGVRPPSPVPTDSTTRLAPGSQAPDATPAAQVAAAPAAVTAPAAATASAQTLAPAAAPAPVKPRSPASAEARGKPKEGAVAVPGKVSALPEPAPGAEVAAPAQAVISLAELPLALQQELPALTISVHAYSARPADRLVGINNRMLREGDSVAPGLTLEQITPEGMVFEFRGYRFLRGVK
jgi:general secretion pathway protein B